MDKKLNKEIQIITNPETNINGKQYRKILRNEKKKIIIRKKN